MVPWTHQSPRYPNGLSIGSAVFVGLISVTDRQGRPTDQQTERPTDQAVVRLVAL